MKTYKSLTLFIPVFLIVVASQLIYLNSLSNQFVYDDEFTIVNNYFIKTWNNLPLLFQKDYFKISGELSYRPVVTLSYFIDYSLWHLNPQGFHLTNSFLHTLTAVLLFFMFTRLLKHRAAAFIGVLLFLCHPILSETVNAVSYREDLLAAAFLIAAFVLYLKINKSKRPCTPAYFASLACYLSGLFSKEMAITLPILIFLYDVTFTGKTSLQRKIFRYYPGYLSITAFYLLVRFVILHNPIESHVSYPNNSVFTNIFTMTVVLASYIKLFFFPVSLCADYVVPFSTSPMDTSFIISLLLLSSGIVVIYKLFFSSKILFFSLVWFFISLLPVLNIVPIENIMAERYLYLPIIGFCLLGTNLISCHCGSMSHFYKSVNIRTVRWMPPLILIPVLALFSLLTIKRNTLWMDQTILWTNTASISPNSFKAHNNLGNIYRNAGKLDEAIHELKYALTLYNDYIDAHNNLGVTYRKKGMLNEALLEYKKALQLNPHYPYAHNNLGVLYAKGNYLDPAIAEFNHAISNKPDYADAHNNLGATYIRQGLYEKAAQECLTAIKYNNRYIDAYYNLSVAYFNNKQPDKALEISNILLALDPNHNDTRKLINLIRENKGLINR